MALPPEAEPPRAAPPPEAGVVGGLVEGNGIVLPDLSLIGLPKTSGGGGLARTSGLDILL